MAQLRQDYSKFPAQDAEILVIGPDSREAFREKWERESIPFVGLADPDHRVAKLYGQQVRLLKLGRMPALVVIDKQGQVRLQHYGSSMSDIPANEKILALLEELNLSESQSPD
jgi:peroxiredoxin Q/BCP